MVAPYTGAWIETIYHLLGVYKGRVAPYTGAWIETAYGAPGPSAGPVAPYTGAWIETLYPSPDFQGVESPPTRGRGLKHGQ